MQYLYEIIKKEEILPIKAFIHSINRFETHWHNEIEIILVLKGTVNVRVGNEVYLLKEDDLLLINRNEIHNTSKTNEDNMLLAVQINPEYYSLYDSRYNKIVFDCKSFLYKKEEQERFNVVRHYLANIVWELNKKRKGYQLIMGSEMNLLAAYLINNFDYYLLEDEKAVSTNKDMSRLKSIIDYINENLEGNLTLQNLADREGLSVYYLSRFIKRKMGLSFQEYLNIIRLDKAVDLLINTNKSITEISYASGFPSPKAFNKKFKGVYNCTPTEYRNGDVSPHGGKEAEYTAFHMNKSRSYLDVDRNTALKKLFTYLEVLDDKTMKNSSMPANIKENISINAKAKGVSYVQYWKDLPLSAGRQKA